MSLIPIVWALSDILALVIGIAYRNILEALKKVNGRIDNIKPVIVKAPEPEETKAVIIDPTDINEQVKREQMETLRKLNPDLDDDALLRMSE